MQLSQDLRITSSADKSRGQRNSTTITKAERFREILAVLARHGIGLVEDEFITHEAGDQARAEHLRRACEELGTMFIKLGQALSTRGDLLPDAYRKELARLQDEVVAVPATVITDIIREDLGAPHDQLFASFDLKPLGSASIGQVHAARLFDRREVVIKVRKPGVDELVRIDLEILGDLIDKWSLRFPVLQDYNARALLQEFKDVLLAEIDYGREAANMKLFRSTFADDNGFKIPAVIEEFSKNRVLTEERLEGRKPSDTADLAKRSKTLVSRRIARFVLEPAFEHGFYYADPHPGNLLIGTNGELSVIDFGKIGRLSREAQRRAADLFIAITRSDAQRLTDRLIEITAPQHPIDRDVITREVDRILELYVDVSLENLRFGEAISEVLQLVRRHGLRLPGALVQFFKALGMCEGILQRRCRADFQAPGAHGCTHKRHDSRSSVHHRRGRSDAVLSSQDMGKMVRRRLLDRRLVCIHRLRKDAVDATQAQVNRLDDALRGMSIAVAIIAPSLLVLWGLRARALK
jgi:ubiquinone biosynthesis protein